MNYGLHLVPPGVVLDSLHQLEVAVDGLLVTRPDVDPEVGLVHQELLRIAPT